MGAPASPAAWPIRCGPRSKVSLPAERLQALMERLSDGEMPGHLQRAGLTWSFSAYDCAYDRAGQRFEGICDLLPRAVSRATDPPAERVVCQRDGAPACPFAGSLQEA
jgi:predicted ArsR family transcriptional regulator